jgi:hypothetical protein
MFNQALLEKWLWHNAYEREASWRLVVEFKYGSQWGRWHFNGVNGSYVVGLWKFIMRGWEDFSRYTRIEMGDGSKISFGMTCGMGNSPLR